MRIEHTDEFGNILGIIDTEHYHSLHALIQALEEMRSYYDFEETELSKPKQIIEMDEVFFMNYMEGQAAPTFKFTKQADALAEAARLSSNHKQPVYTLKAIIKTKPKHDVSTEELKDLSLPEKASE